MFHSYVSLPEGRSSFFMVNKVTSHLTKIGKLLSSKGHQCHQPGGTSSTWAPWGRQKAALHQDRSTKSIHKMMYIYIYKYNNIYIY